MDIAVIGAGHAGIEAAVSGARLGLKTFVFTMNLDSVGNCPCNPSIGGTAKGHLVKEIDALGGVMGKVADKCCIQSRMLNVGKGAAVQSLRMQIDRTKYRNLMKKTLEREKNLFLKQAEIVSISLLRNSETEQIEKEFAYKKIEGDKAKLEVDSFKCNKSGSSADVFDGLDNGAINSVSDLCKGASGFVSSHGGFSNLNCTGNKGYQFSDADKSFGTGKVFFKNSVNEEDKNNLTDIINDISAKNDGYIWVITTRLGTKYLAKSVIITTGTYLNSKIFVGSANYSSGPDGLFPANYLSDSLKKLGIRFFRFKTGTPARVLKSSIDFSNLKEQVGDPNPESFSEYNEENFEIKNKVTCHISWTTPRTKEIILNNIDKSPVYSGDITGTGPRYCPSIEDKIVRFKDKDRHQLFIEPCGENTDEMYLQGMSSGLPEDVQTEFYKTIPGLENVEIMRPAYAIEYDCIDPIQLNETLEFKNIPYLFGAGQFNGSSGYEEAAAQGLIAGINAALKILGKYKLVLTRSNSYIGTLIDDLVTKGVREPYRMMTARSEYRLLLRQDNVYERLSPIGYDLGLVPEDTYLKIKKDIFLKYKEIKRLKSTVVTPSKRVNDFLVSRETSKITTGATLYDILKRPQITYEDLFYINDSMPTLKKHIKNSIEAEVKYSGYVQRQEKEIKDLKRLEDQKLPSDIDYLGIHGLRLEAREKLNKFKPSNVGMASRIAGVNPADVAVLLVYLAKSKTS